MASNTNRFTFYELFAGGGMARAGLGTDWNCLFANDFDHKKSSTYRTNWGKDELVTADIGTIGPDSIPGCANLAWASFPCQDLSLAGGGAGLKGERSGTFWPFWELMMQLNNENRAPDLVVLENVTGALSSHGGKDFAAICKALCEGSYLFGAVVIDAALFVPQSRPRLFIIAVKSDLELPSDISGDNADPTWHPSSLKTAHSKLCKETKDNWIWWSFKKPEPNSLTLNDIIDETPDGVEWHTVEQTKQLLNMMSDVNLAKVTDAKKSGKRVVGTVYKRTRKNKAGEKVQRAEVRFDGVAGCLRTPAGGSSRQLIMVVQGGKIRSRLISSRETARLMGIAESYILPEKYNEAYHLTGDGVVVPVVRYLAEMILEPILTRTQGLRNARAAA